ncbi:MAG: hypothetical protein M0P47_05990 [Bacteroidales bacterium]|nr:hypothetical protein [Bacteroidales bacterium]
MKKKSMILIILLFPILLVGQKWNKADSLAYYTFVAEAQYDMVGNYAASSYYLTKAIRLDPRDPELYRLRASSRENMGDIRGTEADYTMVLQLEPGEIAAYERRAEARVVLKKYQEAIRDFDFLIFSDPEYSGYYYERGLCKKELNDLDGACSDFNQASRLGSRIAYLTIIECCIK